CYVAGFCYRSNLKKCRGSLQKINTETFEIETIMNFPANAYTSFGNLIMGKNEHEFYANVETLNGKKTVHKVVKIETGGDQNRISVVHEFPDLEFSGYWGTYFD